jgi:hypothetical protein
MPQSTRRLGRFREFTQFFALAYALTCTTPELVQLAKETVAGVTMRLCRMRWH